MSLWNTLTAWTTSKAPQLVYARIPAERAPGENYDEEPLETGASYFRLWLSEMHLENDREWFQKCHPAMHSVVRLRFGSEQREIPTIVGALNLPGLAEGTLGTMIPLDYALTTLLPFNGGVVDWSAGLTALYGPSQLNTVLKVVGVISAVVVTPPIAGALAAAQPIMEAFSDLLVSSNGALHLGLHHSFVAKGGAAGRPLRAGYYVAALATAAQLPPETLWIGDGRLRQGASLEKSAPVEGLSYMLFRIESRPSRDDWEHLAAIAEPFERAKRALRERDRNRAEDLVREAAFMALTSPDLTKRDRGRVAQEIKDDFDNVVAAGLGAIPVDSPSTLKQLMNKAIADAGAAPGQITFRTLFG